MSFNLIHYRSQTELQRAHPDITSLKCVYQIPRGMTGEGIIANLRKKNVTGTAYQVGDFVWQPAETMPRVLCICLQHIGDNGPCPEHGPGLSQEPVQ